MFSEFFAWFQEPTLNLEHLLKKLTVIGDFFMKL